MGLVEKRSKKAKNIAVELNIENVELLKVPIITPNAEVPGNLLLSSDTSSVNPGRPLTFSYPNKQNMDILAYEQGYIPSLSQELEVYDSEVNVLQPIPLEVNTSSAVRRLQFNSEQDGSGVRSNAISGQYNGFGQYESGGLDKGCSSNRGLCVSPPGFVVAVPKQLPHHRYENISVNSQMLLSAV